MHEVNLYSSAEVRGRNWMELVYLKIDSVVTVVGFTVVDLLDL